MQDHGFLALILIKGMLFRIRTTIHRYSFDIKFCLVVSRIFGLLKSCWTAHAHHPGCSRYVNKIENNIEDNSQSSPKLK